MKSNLKAHFLKKIQDHHKDQFDRQGAPYWLHPYRVAIAAEKMTRELVSEILDGDDVLEAVEKAFIIGLYHDVLEDVPGSYAAVKEELVDYPELIRSIFLLTDPKEWGPEVRDHLKDEEIDTFKLAETYIEKITAMVSMNDLFAMIVKLCDNEDNSLPWRSKTPGRPNLKYVESKKLLGTAIMESFSA